MAADAIEYAEPRRALAEALINLINKLRQVHAPFQVSLDDYPRWLRCRTRG